jgi:hypothetical protein
MVLYYWCLLSKSILISNMDLGDVRELNWLVIVCDGGRSYQWYWTAEFCYQKVNTEKSNVRFCKSVSLFEHGRGRSR